MVANGHTGKDRSRTANPDVHTKTNGSKPNWTRRLDRMEVSVENGCQVSDQAIVSDNDALIGYDRGTTVDEDALAQHERAIPGSTQLDWYRLAAQEQAAACDRSGGVEHRELPIDSHHGRSRTSPAKCGRSPEAGGHVTNLDHR